MSTDYTTMPLDQFRQTVLAIRRRWLAEDYESIRYWIASLRYHRAIGDDTTVAERGLREALERRRWTWREIRTWSEKLGKGAA